METENIAGKRRGELPRQTCRASLFINPVETVSKRQQRIAVEDPVPERGAADLNRNVHGKQSVIIRLGKDFQILHAEI